MNTADHLDVTIEKLGETGGAGQDGSPSTDELAGRVERAFERFPELIPVVRVSQDRFDLALQYRRPFRRIKNLDDRGGVSQFVAAPASVINDTQEHTPGFASGFG
jgi:hypothetical protein